MTEWISIKDQPFPKNGSYFLSYRKEFRHTDMVFWESYDDWPEGRLIDNHDSFYHPRYCSHWMPLPQLPKD